MADDLGDDWWKDAESDKEKDVLEEKTIKESGGDLTESVHIDQFKDEDTITARKRSRTTEKGDAMNASNKEIDASEKDARRRKRPKKKRITEQPLAAIGADTNNLREELDKFFKGKLSIVEREELALSDDMFGPTNIDLSHTVASFLKEALPKWQRICKAHSQKMSPLILVLSSNANRALRINKEASTFKGDKCKTAKLFARHMKIEDQSKFLRSSVIHFAIGTPARVAALLDQGSLTLRHIRLVMLDWNWRDVKMKRMLDIVDIRKALMNLLKNHIVPACKSHNVKIGLF